MCRCAWWCAQEHLPWQCTAPAGAGRVAGSSCEPIEHSMCTSDAWERSTSRGDLCESDQVGRTTATGFDNEPWRHVSNIVITSMFILLAFGVPRSQALASAVKPTREVILGGKCQQCFAWLAVPIRLVLG